jgi:hypothetical protein
MTKLSDTQLVILSAACQRSDDSVYPLATKLPGGAAAKVLTSLLNKKLIKEVEAKRDDTVWREDKKRGRLTLRATKTAFEALGIDPDGAPASSDEDAAAPAAKASRRKTRVGAVKAEEPRTRADSKQAQLIEMLKSADGATIEEIVTKFGWQAHTVRGAIAGALKKKLGLTVTSEKVENRGRVYRIAE